MREYLVTITDTFGGEANFCWVNKYKLSAKSIRGAIQKIARYTGRTGARLQYKDGEYDARYDYRSPVCAFIEQIDDHTDLNNAVSI